MKCEMAWKVSVGAGGAIAAISESTDEYEQMLLKAAAVVNSFLGWAQKLHYKTPITRYTDST